MMQRVLAVRRAYSFRIDEAAASHSKVMCAVHLTRGLLLGELVLVSLWLSEAINGAVRVREQWERDYASAQTNIFGFDIGEINRLAENEPWPLAVTVAAVATIAVLRVSVLFLGYRGLLHGSRRSAYLLLLHQTWSLASILFISFMPVVMSIATGPARILPLGLSVAIVALISVGIARGAIEVLRLNRSDRDPHWTAWRILNEWLSVRHTILRLFDIAPGLIRARAVGAIATTVLGVTLHVGGFTVYAAAPFVFASAISRQNDGRPRTEMSLGWATTISGRMAAVLGVGYLSLFAAGRLRQVARRMAISQFGRSAGGKNYPHLVFLRPFEEGTMQLPVAGEPWYLKLWDPGVKRRTLADLLLHEMSHVAPVMTVRDQRRETFVGIRTVDLPDVEWQDSVSKSIRDARKIVVAVGNTPGLLWEIDAIVALGALSKAVFIFPPRNTMSAEVVNRLLTRVGLAAGVESLHVAISLEHVISVSLSAEGNLLLITSESATHPNYEAALRLAIAGRVTPAVAGVSDT